MNRAVAFVGLLAVGIAMWGCSGKAVQPAGPRAPTTPDQVTIYPKLPSKDYEVLGTVVVPLGGDVRFDERGEAVAGFDRLKAQAAALGANGLLLEIKPEQFDVLATTGYHGTFYKVPIKLDPRRAVADAIYVPPPK
jgi:hypothetical protein